MQRPALQFGRLSSALYYLPLGFLVLFVSGQLVNAARLAAPQSPLSKAQDEESDGLYQQAVRDYRDALEQLPHSEPAIKGLGRSLAHLGRCEEAGNVLSKLPASDAGYRETLAGVCYFRRLEFDQAIPALEKAVRLAPHDKQARIFLAQSYASAGRYQEAIDLLRSREDGNDADSLYWIGKFYEDLADQAFDRMVAKNPHHYLVYETEGDQYLAKQQYDEAIEAYKHAMASAPPFTPGLHSKLGNAYWRTLRLDEAETELAEELKHNPYHAQANYELGDIYAKRDEPARAIPLLEEALTLNPSLVEAHRSLGRAFSSEKQYERALKEFLAVAAAKPSDHTIHAVLANTYRLIGRIEDAKRESERSEELEREEAQKQESSRQAQRTVGETPAVPTPH